MSTTNKPVMLYLGFENQDNWAAITNAKTKGYMGELFFDWGCSDIEVSDFIEQYGETYMYALVADFHLTEHGTYAGVIKKWSPKKFD